MSMVEILKKYAKVKIEVPGGIVVLRKDFHDWLKNYNWLEMFMEPHFKKGEK